MEIKENERPVIRKIDMIIILTLIIFAALFLLIINSKNNADVYYEIIYDGEVIASSDLLQNKSFSSEINPDVVFEIRDGKIAFIHSDCPDKICVNTGFISKPSEAAVCMPNKLMIRIKSRNDTADIDVVAG